MKWSDRNTILARAAQYDLQLARSRAREDRPARLHVALARSRDGPAFPNRDLAIHWMAEWLDADTAEQELALVDNQRRQRPQLATGHKSGRLLAAQGWSVEETIPCLFECPRGR